MVHEVFGRGNEFARKITYRVTKTNSTELINEFRNSYYPRIVVTVDMLLGIDVKPVEVIVFMRSVKSRVLFEQIIGLGCLTISDEAFGAVTPDAYRKTRYVVVDAVGVTEQLDIEASPPALSELRVWKGVFCGSLALFVIGWTRRWLTPALADLQIVGRINIVVPPVRRFLFSENDSGNTGVIRQRHDKNELLTQHFRSHA
jgi:hypothetical protein